MTTYYMQDKHDHYRYTRISKPRAYWEWLTYAVEWLVCWHEINPCTFHHFGWRFWHWVPCWAYCEAMEGGDIAEQSYLDSFRKVEYSDNGRVAVITAYWFLPPGVFLTSTGRHSVFNQIWYIIDTIY